MTERLCEANLIRLPSDVRKPSYDRAALKAGVVHIGPGAFHRAHQAPIFENLIQLGDMRWGVVGASLRSPAAQEALVPQDGLYTLLVEEDERRMASIIGSLLDVILAPKDPHRLIDAIASPTTHIVTITVTEKGYKLDPSSGDLIVDDPEISAELRSLDAPATMPGYLTAGLRLRRDRGLAPITIASCDNLIGNGEKLSRAVVQIASAHDQRLADWIGQHCAFPNSMVDRMVPAMSEHDITVSTARLGVLDLATVRTEPFSQWVIEQRLTGTATQLERAGVEVVSDLAPWERAKLRLLNGAHSAMAYLGGLAGIERVDGFVREPWGRSYVSMLWDEIETSLAPPPELDVPEYRNALMRRFANRALGHRLRQIAMDGSQKLPPRLVAPATELIARGKKPCAIALAIAGWMQWQSGRDDNGSAFGVDDPLSSTTTRLVAASDDAAEQARALLSLGSIFPPALSNDRVFAQLVAKHLEHLKRFGARRTTEQFIGKSVIND